MSYGTAVFMYRLHDFLVDGNRVFMLMEFAIKGDFKRYLRYRGRIEEKEALHYLFQLLHAVASLHANDIIHRDIKLENMLLNDNAEVKLCDFGWVSPPEDPERNIKCGTYEYMAPEVVMQKPYDHKIDVWSIGILAYELVHGSTPFVSSTPQEIEDKILKGTFNLRVNLSYEFRDFIISCLAENPSSRSSTQQLISHTVFTSIIHYYYSANPITSQNTYSNTKSLQANLHHDTDSQIPSRFSHLHTEPLEQQTTASTTEYNSSPKHRDLNKLPAELQLLNDYNKDHCDIEPAEPPGGITFLNIEDYVEFDVGLAGVIDYLKDKGQAFLKLFSHSPEIRKTFDAKYKSPSEIKRLLNRCDNDDASYHYSPGFKSPVRQGDSFKVRANMYGQYVTSKFSKPVPQTPAMEGVSPENNLRSMHSASLNFTDRLKGIFGYQESPKYTTSTDMANHY